VTAPNFAPGTVVAGRFTIRALLGYGGSSATFRAMSGEGRDVALKSYSPVIGQRPDVMGQLQQYVAATNALPPDLCATILEAGYDPATASPFTVTDFIANPSIAQLVMHRPLSPEEVSAVLRTLAAVLDAAHARDVFHLGIKPTNLFVDQAAPGNLKVTDIGTCIARSALPTQEGYMTAAPWMAPEQVQGGLPLGAAADIFSAALVAFFALVGRPYWRSCQGAPDLNAWQRELLSPRTLASARAAELGTPLDPALDAIFARALAIDPRERYRTMSEFAAAFGGFPSGLGTAQTLAFPAGAAGAYAVDPGPPGQAQGGYPPVGGTGGGMGGYPPVDALHGQPGMGVGGMGGMGGMPPGMGAPGMPEMPPSALQTQVPMPGGGGAPGTGRSPSGRLMPIVVGAVAVLLAGSAAMAFYLIGKSDETAGPVAATSASADQPATPSSSAATPTPTETAAPADSAAPTPDSPAAAGPDAGTADAGPGLVAVKITCTPEACEEITVDQKPVTGGDLQLAPGTYRIAVKRAGFFPRFEAIRVEAGKPLEKEFALSAIPKGPLPTGGGTPTKKDCGKFIKKCK